MYRVISLSVLVLLLAISAMAATPCNLDISLACTGNNCSSTVRNVGSSMCTGEYIVGFFVVSQLTTATLTNFRQTLGLTQCFDSGTLQVGFPLGICFGNASLGPGNSFNMSAQINLNGTPLSDVVALTEVIDPLTGDELALVYVFGEGGATTCTPVITVPPVTQSGVPYSVTWLAVSDANTAFTLDEATDPNFTANLVTQSVSGRSQQFQHTVSATTTYYYRVRANSCSGAPGPNSATTSIVVQAQAPVTGRSGDAAVPHGSTTPVRIPFFIANPTGKQALADVPFTATTDKPYLSVTPSSGTIPPGGMTVTVIANPSNLPPGANMGTLIVTSPGAQAVTKGVSVSLVTPAGPGTKGLPPPNALIIPAVAHAPGALGPFQSDVRLTNGTLGTMNYQITFTPTGKDGTKEGKTTTISVETAQTIALNDILKDFFGIGATDDPADNGQGALEIRPLGSSATQTYAASRTFTFNTKGTFGQFIAAIPFSAFATKASVVPLPGQPPPTGTPTLSMQQIAQSPSFRTNLGLVEGSGTAANGNIIVYDGKGIVVKTIPYSLPPAGHQQKSLADLGVSNLADGRIEVTVESSTGAVTAYASVLDNKTNDPLAVTPVQVSEINATRYVLPGMVALDRATDNFHSDIRIYNGGTTSTTVNATFYPQGDGTPRPAPNPIVIPRGEVAAFDDVIASLFNANGLGGSIVLTTSSPSKLVATGRTYTIVADNGTFGQFIPGVSPAQGIGLGDRALEVLQLEQSANFRSNVGLSELSGNAARVRVSAYGPDSKTAVSSEFDLKPNEFRQLTSILSSSGFNLGANVYNARVSVEVVSGTGRVTAYGSIIDNLSLDPTYVPAQK